MPRPTSGTWLWFNLSEIPYDTWDYLDGVVKLEYGLPQLVTALFGWIFNVTMFLASREKVSKNIRDTFFFWTLMLLTILNMLQLVNHLFCAFLTLAMDYEIYATIITISLARAACYCSDMVRGIIAMHRLIIVVFPFQLHAIPKAGYVAILLLVVGLFFGVFAMYLTPAGAFIYWANEVFFEEFDDQSLQFDINRNMAKITNYITLVAGAISYGILVPVVLLRRRKSEQNSKEQNFALPLFVTFLCSVTTFILWEMIPPVYVHGIKDPELRKQRRVAFAGYTTVIQVLWILQCSQEPAVLFIFNKNLRQAMLRNLICNALENKLERVSNNTVQTKASTKR